jgi:hypothetical protein
MTVARKPKSKQPAVNWQAAGSPEGLDQNEQIAHAIITEHSDLMPSVARIMTAALDDEGRTKALELFRNALRTPRDPNRDPRVAIANVLPVES